MCRAKEVAEQIHNLREEEKDSMYRWFLDDVVSEMLERKVTSVNRTIHEIEHEFEMKGYKYDYLNLANYLKKEGFDATSTVDYEQNPYGYDIFIKREYLYKE